MASELKQPIDIAEYLFRRLHELGIRGVHGVPGDYNLVALDYIPKCGLNWVGNCNELNAGYAADGYARVKGISALVTTFGVGELSAINAIAGAYSEYVPIVHIVGVPSTLSQKNGMLLHHTLGNGNFKVFAECFKEISIGTANIHDEHDAAQLIDEALRNAWVFSRPAYITLPTDCVEKKVEGERLERKLDLEVPRNDEDVEDYVVQVIIKYLEAAEKAVILVDACAVRHRVMDETHALISATGFPTAVSPMGKGAVNETLPNYIGVYAGDASHSQPKSFVESSDLLLSIGGLKSDFNSGGFSYHVSQRNTIEFHSTHMKVKHSVYPGVRMKWVLQRLLRVLEGKNAPSIPARHPKLQRVLTNQIPPTELGEALDAAPEITHDYLWPRVGQWLAPGDIVITETGTANFGIWEATFPDNVLAISQVLWGSIGYSVGACQGAALAAKEMDGTKEGRPERRVILFVGDGSFQLTVQEVSTMIRRGLKPIIFLINNDGYTIERMIHGPTASYNDIQPWHHLDLVAAFGGTAADTKTYTVKTKREIHALFKDEEFCRAEKLQFVELFMPKEDAPKALKWSAEAAARINAKVQ